MDLQNTSASELAQQIRQRRTSAAEVTAAYLARISQFDGQLNAYITVDAAGALRRAQEIDAELRAGQDPGPLAGLPLALKDNLVTVGLQTSCASRLLAGWLPPYDGSQAARLRQAGAVILGKLNLDEFAMGSSNEHSASGPCHNPWDLQRVPGGSSGGAAAAVAAGLCAGALGSDTGGSIRQPAAFCGVVGLKPSYGRVSRYGLVAFASSLEQVGPICCTVRDAAALLEVLAGFDPRDSTSSSAPVGCYRQACERGLRGLRLGVPREYLREGLDAELERALGQALVLLEQLGAELVEISLPHTRYAVATYYLIADAEASANLARFDGVRYGQAPVDAAELTQRYCQARGALGPEVKRRIMLGTFTLSAGFYEAYYAQAQKVRALVRQDFARAFERCQLIVTPTTPGPAFRLGERLADPLQMYLADVFTCAANLAGLPGLSLPCGFTAGGLPLGLQLLGPPLAEEPLLAAAAAYEDAAGWAGRRPPLVAAALEIEAETEAAAAAGDP